MTVYNFNYDAISSQDALNLLAAIAEDDTGRALHTSIDMIIKAGVNLNSLPATETMNVLDQFNAGFAVHMMPALILEGKIPSIEEASE